MTDDRQRDLDNILGVIKSALNKEYLRGAADMRAKLMNALDMSLPNDAELASATAAGPKPRRSGGGRKRKIATLIRATYTDPAEGQDYQSVIGRIRAMGEHDVQDPSIRNEMRRMEGRHELRRDGDQWFLAQHENGLAEQDGEHTGDTNASLAPTSEASFLQ